MSRLCKSAAIILALALLGACSTADLTELQGTILPDQPVQATLAAEYRSFAVWEAEQYDWPDSQHFARKGLRAAGGEPSWQMERARGIEPPS